MAREKAAGKIILISYLLLFLAAAALIFVGRYRIDANDLLSLLKGKATKDALAAAHVLLVVRLPRLLSAVLVGSALSVSGAAYQGIFKNPMVSPSLLGVSSGAGFGAALSIVLKLSGTWTQLFAFAFGIAAVSIVYFTSSLVSKGNNKTLTIVLVGVVVSSLFASLISLIKYVGDPLDDLPAITFWLMGSLSSVMMADVWPSAIPILIGIIGLMVIKWRINIMSLSEEEAMSLGLATNKVRFLAIACATLATAGSVSLSGNIGWVGLVIPHIMRMFVGNDYKYVIPASIAGGGLYILIIDMLSRSLFAVEIPLGILTAVIGTPMFLYIMVKRKKFI
jgi:iron complex transport system permease protein